MAGFLANQASGDTVGGAPDEPQTAWDQAVPVASEDSLTHPKTRTSNDSYTSQNKPSRRVPLAHNANGASLARKSSREANEVSGVGNSKSGSVNDTAYLVPNRIGALSRHENSVSRKGSEPDSLLDLYGPSSSRSNLNSMDWGERKGINSNNYREEEDTESAKWIHRDKLAKIESEELQQAGIQLPATARLASKSNSSARGHSKDRHTSNGTNDVDQAEQWASAREEKRRRISSPAPIDNDDAGADDGAPMSFDLRTPEEIAADPYEEGGSSRLYMHQNLKKSTSRIPVLTSSPLPIPQEHIERDTPLLRSRKLSIGEDDSNGFSKTRLRSQSASSQVMLDNMEPVDNTLTPATGSRPGSKSSSNMQISPTKAKVPGKATPTGSRKTTPTARKTSNVPKQRTASNNATSLGQRPVTRSGEGRPSTAVNRPEGEAPWIATMYKPDPRLPPDQQIIPTHAKRQQAEQWEKEGALPTTYDRAFSPLAVHTSDGLKPPTSPVAATATEEDGSWPLKPAISPPEINSRPGTSGTDHAGYSTMPKMQTAPPVAMAPSPKLVQQQMRVQEPPPQQHLEVQKEHDRKEKSCGCCIMM